MAKREEDRNDVDSGQKAKEAAAKKHLVQEFGQSKGKRMISQADRMAVSDFRHQGTRHLAWIWFAIASTIWRIFTPN